MKNRVRAPAAQSLRSDASGGCRRLPPRHPAGVTAAAVPQPVPQACCRWIGVHGSARQRSRFNTVRLGRTALTLPHCRRRQVYALVDQTGDGKADQMTVLLPDVYWPNGIAWRNNSLYISGFYNQRWVGGLWVGCGWRGALRRVVGAVSRHRCSRASNLRALAAARRPLDPPHPPCSGTMLGFIAKYDDIDQYALKNQVGGRGSRCMQRLRSAPRIRGGAVCGTAAYPEQLWLSSRVLGPSPPRSPSPQPPSGPTSRPSCRASCGTAGASSALAPTASCEPAGRLARSTSRPARSRPTATTSLLRTPTPGPPDR